MESFSLAVRLSFALSREIAGFKKFSKPNYRTSLMEPDVLAGTHRSCAFMLKVRADMQTEALIRPRESQYPTVQAVRLIYLHIMPIQQATVWS